MLLKRKVFGIQGVVVKVGCILVFLMFGFGILCSFDSFMMFEEDEDFLNDEDVDEVQKQCEDMFVKEVDQFVNKWVFIFKNVDGGEEVG